MSMANITTFLPPMYHWSPLLSRCSLVVNAEGRSFSIRPPARDWCEGIPASMVCSHHMAANRTQLLRATVEPTISVGHR